MTDSEEFLAWIHGPLREGELALHNGDPAPRRALWSRNEPVSVLGAWRNATGQREVDELFGFLGDSFSNCTSFITEVERRPPPPRHRDWVRRPTRQLTAE